MTSPTTGNPTGPHTGNPTGSDTTTNTDPDQRTEKQGTKRKMRDTTKMLEDQWKFAMEKSYKGFSSLSEARDQFKKVGEAEWQNIKKTATENLGKNKPVEGGPFSVYTDDKQTEFMQKFYKTPCKWNKDITIGDLFCVAFGLLSWLKWSYSTRTSINSDGRVKEATNFTKTWMNFATGVVAFIPFILIRGPTTKMKSLTNLKSLNFKNDPVWQLLVIPVLQVAQCMLGPNDFDFKFTEILNKNLETFITLNRNKAKRHGTWSNAWLKAQLQAQKGKAMNLDALKGLYYPWWRMLDLVTRTFKFDPLLDGKDAKKKKPEDVFHLADAERTGLTKRKALLVRVDKGNHYFRIQPLWKEEAAEYKEPTHEYMSEDDSEWDEADDELNNVNQFEA